MTIHTRERTAPQGRAALLPVLLAIAGCNSSGVHHHLWIEPARIEHDFFYRGLVLDPVRTIKVPPLPFNTTVDVLKWWDMEVLEIPCVEVWTSEALYAYSREPDDVRPDVELSSKDIADIYTLDQCHETGMSICKRLLHDEGASFRLVGRLIWHGGRRKGPALYVQCLSGAEFRELVRSPRATPAWYAAKSWQRYLRLIESEEAKKHPSGASESEIER